MSQISESLAYVEGLIEGMELKDDTKEGKAILAILDLLEDIVEEVVELDEDVEDIKALNDELDEDLGTLEEFVFGDMCDCDCDCEDYDEDDFDLGDIIYEDDDAEGCCECGCDCQ